jgi:exosortase
MPPGARGSGAWPIAAVAAVAWIWLAAACSTEWSGNPDYAHGWIVLPLAVYFLWKRLGGISPAQEISGARVLAWAVLFAGAVLVLPLELGRQAPLYWRVFPWGIFAVVSASTLACAYLAGGRPYAAAAVFPLLFLASGIPWPNALEQPLTVSLMHGVSSFLAGVLPLAGIPAQREGTTIVLLNCTVGVEEACSGIRSLQSAVMIALAAGEFFHVRTRNRLLLLAAGFCLAVASNAGRTLALTLAGIAGGNPAMEKIHDAAGVSALGFLAAGLFALGWWMRRASPPPASAGDLQPVRWMPSAAVLAVGLAGYAGASAWYAVNESRRPAREDRPLLSVDVSAEVTESPIPAILQRGLAPDAGSFARVALPDGSAANGFHFFWNGSKNNAEQLYHRPDSCMPEGGWNFVGPESKAGGTIDGLPVEWSVLPYEKGGRHALLLWASWVDGRQIPFSVNAGSAVQRNNLWRLIGDGRRTFSYESAAVLVPYSGTPPVESAAQAADKMFSHP